MYKKIMVPLDGSKLAECVLTHLLSLIKDSKTPPETVLVSAVEPISIPMGRELSQFSSIEQVKDFEQHQKSDAQRYLKEKVAYLKDNGVSASAAIIFGKAGDALIKYARDHSVDLIIIGTHGRSGITRVVRGSVAEHVLQSGIPVLMIKSVADSIQSKSSP